MKLVHWLCLLTMVAGLASIADRWWWKSGLGNSLGGLCVLLSLSCVIAARRHRRDPTIRSRDQSGVLILIGVLVAAIALAINLYLWLAGSQ